MRFLADGPSIPDELLVARDEGRVVFFCGAGVSLARAKLPDFLGLTRAVADKLAVSANSPTRQLIEAIEKFPQIEGVGSLISADRVFGLIEREFLQRDIYAAIASTLKSLSTPDLSAHRILLDLARSPNGKTRLITTNFDLLFEACDAALVRSHPPKLPDPSREDEFYGIIHLHGHVNDDYSGAVGDGFVISSAEFGRAYLSERWATDFIRAILARYIVVFVGYAADDPPMQYLLEALNRTAGSLSGVYAFQSGSKEDAEARWTQKGVQSIAYDGGSNHSTLWNTLEAWANRARNPDGWHNDLIHAAQRGPEHFQPFQRGQMAHIISTVDGARRFARAENPPTGSWLCSFDPYVRFSKPGHLMIADFERGPYFDPFDAFGLDDDPVPKKLKPDSLNGIREKPAGVWDCFAPNRHDRLNVSDDQFAAFRGHFSYRSPRLSARLNHIERWIGRVANDPATVWWAARQTQLHPEVQQQIKNEIEQNGATYPDVIRKAWRLIFDAWKGRNDDAYAEWFSIVAEVKIDDWSESTVRQAAMTRQPFLVVEAPIGSLRPPEPISDLQLRHLVRADVKYPEINEDISVPDELLPLLVKLLRRNLETAIALENRIGGYGLHNLDPLYDAPSAHPYGINRAVAELVKYFSRLAEGNAPAARIEVQSWQENDDRIFARLRIWACGNPDVVTGSDVGSIIGRLENSVFWEGRSQRDLLLTLSKRWADLPADTRAIFEQRLLYGPSQWKNESPSNFQERSAFETLSRLYWLKASGCEFSFDFDKATEKIKEIAKWDEAYGSRAADSMASRAGWVKTDTESEALEKIPLSQVLSRASELSGRRSELFVEYDPYAGLASSKPVRALAAIRAAGDGYDSSWAWQTFLNAEARKNDKPRFICVIAARLHALDDGEFSRLARPISDWFLRVSKILLESNREIFDPLWGRLIENLNTNERVGDSSVLVEDKEHDWATEALNSPAGYLAQALFNDLPTDAKGQSELPKKWRSRADQLLALPGNSRRHALAIICYHLAYLFYVDPIWTERALVSVLFADDKDDRDAFWAGFFWRGRAPQEPLYLRMKPALLSLAHDRTLLKRLHAENLAAILLIGWIGRETKTGNRPISSNEMRSLLVESDDDFRSQVVWHLDTWSKEQDSNWARETIPFLKEVWPRQIAAKTPRISARLAELAFSHEDEFPDYVDAVLPLVIPINQDHLTLPSLRRSEGRNVLDKFPERALALLAAILPDDGRRWPFGIEDALRRIGQADPSLLNDTRLIELNRIWNAR